MKPNYEKQQVHEQEQTNYILIINTVFTILTGIATIILSIIAIWK
jgi:hypothetical protein